LRAMDDCGEHTEALHPFNISNFLIFGGAG